MSELQEPVGGKDQKGPLRESRPPAGADAGHHGDQIGRRALAQGALRGAEFQPQRLPEREPHLRPRERVGQHGRVDADPHGAAAGQQVASAVPLPFAHHHAHAHDDAVAGALAGPRGHQLAGADPDPAVLLLLLPAHAAVLRTVLVPHVDGAADGAVLRRVLRVVLLRLLRRHVRA